MDDLSWLIIAISVVLHIGMYLVHRKVVRRMEADQRKSDEAWKAAIDEIQKQLYG